MKFKILLFSIIFSTGCSSEKGDNDWAKDNLRGEVYSYSEFSYTAEDRFGVIEKNIREREKYWENDSKIIYNKHGNIIERKLYNSDGSLAKKLTLKGDENGNVIERKVYDSDGKLFEDFSFKYTYDEHGNWTKRIDYLNDFPKYILEREYEYYR